MFCEVWRGLVFGFTHTSCQLALEVLFESTAAEHVSFLAHAVNTEPNTPYTFNALIVDNNPL